MTTIKNQTIQACYEQLYVNNYDNLRLCFLRIGTIFSDDSIRFRAYLDNMLLTGEELVYYPELAQRLRATGSYPCLTRDYLVKDAPEGIVLIPYFAKKVMASYRDFQKELKQHTQKAKRLIKKYGTQWRLPIVDHFEYENDGRTPILVINGIKWIIEPRYGCQSCAPDIINLRNLLNISQQVDQVWLEDARTGTPFIALRISKNYGNKGRIYWYSLETGSQISQKDMEKWKKVQG